MWPFCAGMPRRSHASAVVDWPRSYRPPECGSQFTTNLENMFKDIEVSHDIMLAFKQVRCNLLGRLRVRKA